MSAQGITDVLGISVPSTQPFFLSVVGMHVLFGIAAVATGALAMLSKKGRGRHSTFGKAYFWCLLGVFLTMSTLSLLRWSENYDLFIVGALSFGFAYFGRLSAGRYEPQWLRVHVTAMAFSYISMLTAFYVDNGKNLPLWRDLPQLAFWFLPAAVGLPILLYVIIRRPTIANAARTPATTVQSNNPR
jgi:hypothetical protein